MQEKPAAAAQPTEPHGMEYITVGSPVAPPAPVVAEQKANEEIQPEPQNEQATAEAIYEPDSGKTQDEKLIEQLLQNAADYRTSYSDSKVLQEKKKRDLNRLRAQIQKKNQGRRVAFADLYVVDVEAEQEPTQYGKAKIKSILRQLRRDPQTRALFDTLGSNLEDNPLLQIMVAGQLVLCKKCMRKTGRFEVTFKLRSYNGPEHKIIRIVNSENEALQFEKEKAYAVS